MDGSRKFCFRNKEWHCAVELQADGLCYSWDYRGFGVDKGKKAFVRSELAQKIGEYSGARRLKASSARLPGVYAVLAMFSYALLPLPWRYSTFIFLLFLVISVFRVVMNLRRRDWLQIYTKANQHAVSIDVTKWTLEERTEFRRSYEQFIEKPNQQPQRNALDLT
jgi:hypothetical protein